MPLIQERLLEVLTQYYLYYYNMIHCITFKLLNEARVLKMLQFYFFSAAHTVAIAVGYPIPQAIFTFPCLDLKEMSKEEKQHLQQRLYIESIAMAEKFQRLFSDTTESLKRQKVTVREILCHLVGLGPLLPTYDDLKLPIFRRQLPALRNAKSVDDAMQVIGDYCSFFNFRMIDHIISKLGKIRDKKNLSKYEEEFHNYCQHHIFECPSELGSISNGHAKMFVKLDKTYENCTIEILHLFVNKLWSIFNVSSATGLKLCRIERGCLKLTFQLPFVAVQDIFPLSREQESALSSLGVDNLWLIYHFNQQQYQVLIIIICLSFI